MRGNPAQKKRCSFISQFGGHLVILMHCLNLSRFSGRVNTASPKNFCRTSSGNLTVIRYARLLPSVIGKRGIWLAQHLVSQATFPVIKRELRPTVKYATLFSVNRDLARQLFMTWWENTTHQMVAPELLAAIYEGLTLDDEFMLESIGAYLTRHRFYQLCTMLFDLPGSRLRTLFEQHMQSLLDYDHTTGNITFSNPQRLHEFISKQAPYCNWRLRLWHILVLVPPRYWMQRWQIDAAAFLSAIEKHPGLRRMLRAMTVAALQTGDSEFVRLALQHHDLRLTRGHIFEAAQRLSPADCAWLATRLFEYFPARITNNPGYDLLAKYRVVIRDTELVEAISRQLEHGLSAEDEDRSYARLTIRLYRRYVPVESEARFIELLVRHERPNDISQHVTRETRLFFDFRRRMHAAFGDEQS